MCGLEGGLFYHSTLQLGPIPVGIKKEQTHISKISMFGGQCQAIKFSLAGEGVAVVVEINMMPLCNPLY